MMKRKTKKKWRPSRSNSAYTDFTVRLLFSEADLIQEAVEAQSQRLGAVISRNQFCVQAVIAAAKSEIAKRSRAAAA